MLKHVTNTPIISPEFEQRPKTIIISEGTPILADGMRTILQNNCYLNDFVITSLNEIDPAALTVMSPDILILDPWESLLRNAAMADIVSAMSATTSLIGYCSEMTTSQARSLVEAGFRGLFPKTLKTNEFAKIIIAVACGGVYLQESYAEQPIEPKDAQSDSLRESTDLSEREAEVLRHVALGCSMKEISNLLQISTKTVDTYKSRANQKLNLRSRSDIVRYAIQSGWMN